MGYLVFAGCQYEALALASRGRLATITRMVHQHRRLPGVEIAVWAGIAWLSYHLLFEGRGW